MALLTEIQNRVRQHTNRPFLKAAMAASALAAYADGKVTISERYSIDHILDTMETLKIYDPHKAIEILKSYLMELETNPITAQKVLTNKLTRIASDKDAAYLIARIALQVSYADGDFSEVEKGQFASVCRALGLEPKDVYPAWAKD